jgi:uncharacterized protein YbbC (DUF1343 family)
MPFCNRKAFCVILLVVAMGISLDQRASSETTAAVTMRGSKSQSGKGKAVNHKKKKKIKLPAEDVVTSHLWGDTAVPPDRKERFFEDEAPAKVTSQEESETTKARELRLKKLRAATDAISTASNARWEAEHRDLAAIPVNFPGVKVKLGDEVLFSEPKYRALLKGKRVGLITNPSGMDSHFISTIDKLMEMPDCKLTALFAPEHGVRGAQGAGEKVKSEVDPLTGVPVYSLHGQDEAGNNQRKPRKSMLHNVDVLVYDIQDIGNRSYTYTGTMKLCMQAAKENGKKFIILDRPNPMGGNLVSGNVLDPKYVTLVGWGPVAYIYGMTCGEMGQMLNETTGIHCDLTVVPMQGWNRNMKWWDTGLPWIPTSTHMQHPEDCWFIAITGTFGELNSINEGVGYPAPFQYVGAPWIDSIRLAHELNSRKLPGLYFRPAYFKPYYHIFKDEQCGGVQIFILDYDKVMPVEAGTHILEAINNMYPEQKVLTAGSDADSTKTRSRISAFNKVMGTNKVRKALLKGKSADEINASWVAEREKFIQDRRKYLLYK